jgi:hypothetical protein
MPAAEDIALFEERGIEGMQIFPAGGLARQRRSGKVLPRAVQDEEVIG